MCEGKPLPGAHSSEPGVDPLERTDERAPTVVGGVNEIKNTGHARAVVLIRAAKVAPFQSLKLRPRISLKTRQFSELSSE